MTVDSEAVVDGLVTAGVPRSLAEELMAAFVEAKRRFYLGDHRPNAVEGGRFAEAAFRVLQWATEGGKYTALGKTLPSVDDLVKKLINAQGPESIRKHIPRALQVIYGIRNTRDAAHLGDGIDPNLQDASLVVHTMDWVLAELVRLYHSVSPHEAQNIIDELVTRQVPAIQEIAGVPRVLREMKASDYVLVLLYFSGAAGVGFSDLSSWVRPKMRNNLRRTLRVLVERDMAHQDDSTYYILRPGERYVERERLIQPVE
jgi:hypothetical protein